MRTLRHTVRKMRCAGHRPERDDKCTEILLKHLKQTAFELSVDERILLKWLKELRCVAMDIEFVREHSNGPFIYLWPYSPLLDLGRFSVT
jgi:hypothetical protein